MERMQRTCPFCRGYGHTVLWEIVSEDADTHTCTMENREVKCSECNGSGYKEYAVFSIEEAEAILKHCGLDKE